MCVSSITTRRHAEIRDAAPGAPRWLQVYILADRGPHRGASGRGSRLRLLGPRPHGRHAVLGAGASGTSGSASRCPPTCRSPTRSTDDRSVRTGSRSFRCRRRSRGATSSGWPERTRLPVLVKGVLTREDAKLAVEHGAAGDRSSRTTAAGSSTASRRASTRSPRSWRRSAGRVPVLMDGGDPARQRRVEGARARRAGRARRALRCSTASRRTARRESRACSSCCATSWSARSRLLGCTRPAEVGHAHVQPTVPYAARA